ncbi:uncharacterized protein HD556DRAFT_1314396 [Suillus plorans]|uniref:Uncharacterized protein n=1 Tax=Suillus plorans TaxID=116603 RepID=A0A9P7AAW7_9AGAM|nr:uncharacterized protein HD556DRAFT_1314396 [Suillus plorans]KAG1785278.1 hypothetical protein HD556DRAFT_1314396 [Suillus plorans]
MAGVTGADRCGKHLDALHYTAGFEEGKGWEMIKIHTNLGGMYINAVPACKGDNEQKQFHLYQPAQAAEYAFLFIRLTDTYLVPLDKQSPHLRQVARLKRPAGTADRWEYASHRGIREPRDASGTLGVP